MRTSLYCTWSSHTHDTISIGTTRINWAFERGPTALHSGMGNWPLCYCLTPALRRRCELTWGGGPLLVQRSCVEAGSVEATARTAGECEPIAHSAPCCISASRSRQESWVWVLTQILAAIIEFVCRSIRVPTNRSQSIPMSTKIPYWKVGIF
jgi:hypothetical protein